MSLESTPLAKESELDIQSPKLLVYERRNIKENEGIHTLEQNQSLDPPVLDDGNQNSLANHASSENPCKSLHIEDLDIPIALRKGKRTGTSHRFHTTCDITVCLLIRLLLLI